MSPLVPAALVAAGAYLLAVPPLISLLAAAVGTATSIAIASRSSTTIAVPATVACAVALLIGSVACETVNVSSLHLLGVQPDSVRHLSGVLEAEVLPAGQGGGGRSLLWLHVSEASTDWATVSCDASVGVFVDTSGPISPGSEVALAVDGIREGDDGRLFANGIDVRTPTSSVAGSFRTRLTENIESRLDAIGPSASSLLPALLLGRRDGMSLRTETLFRRAGASHVLALSGMHLGILAAAIAFALRPIVGQTAAGIATCCFAILYTGLVGPRPSLVRAVIMCLLVTAGWLSGRRWHLLELLCGAFLIHLVIQPIAAAEVGFTLSYLALAGIAVVSPTINRCLQSYVPRVICLPLSAGIGAQVATLPIVLGVFGVAYPVGVVSGIVLGPVVVVLMIGGAGVAAASSLSSGVVVSFLSAGVDAVARVTEEITWFFAAGPSIGRNLLGPAAVAAAAVLLAGLVIEWRRVACPGA